MADVETLETLKRYDGGQVIFFSDDLGKMRARVGSVILPSPAFRILDDAHDGGKRWAVVPPVEADWPCKGGTLRTGRLFDQDMNQTEPLGVGLKASGAAIQVASLEIKPGDPIEVTGIAIELEPDPKTMAPSLTPIEKAVPDQTIPDPGSMGVAGIKRAPGNEFLDDPNLSDEEKGRRVDEQIAKRAEVTS